jgi:hypothetical protein
LDSDLLLFEGKEEEDEEEDDIPNSEEENFNTFLKNSTCSLSSIPIILTKLSSEEETSLSLSILTNISSLSNI